MILCLNSDYSDLYRLFIVAFTKMKYYNIFKYATMYDISFDFESFKMNVISNYKLFISI